ncbi:Peroxidase 64-like protein [Drosera capensis]
MAAKPGITAIIVVLASIEAKSRGETWDECGEEGGDRDRSVGGSSDCGRGRVLKSTIVIKIFELAIQKFDKLLTLKREHTMNVWAFVLSLVVICYASSFGDALSSNYYERTCPGAESVITNVVMRATQRDNSVPAALLRLHFHDCFIRGCDASVLLDSVGGNNAEKQGRPNLTLRAFDAIDDAKKELEFLCPGVVSCADILALAARDAVMISGGPTWDVPKGRKDGRTSIDMEARSLPAPRFTLFQLQQSFTQRGLTGKELVALSGGHTLGFSHCRSFEDRISITLTALTTLTHQWILLLQKAFGGLLILQGRGLLTSDQTFLTSLVTKDLVTEFADSQEAFYNAFVESMIKMSSITGGVEVRRNCH